MKVMETIDVIVKLKEKISEAQTTNAHLADQLQKLLDGIIANPKSTPSI